MLYCQRVPTSSDQANIEHTHPLNHYWCLEPNRKNSAVLFVVAIDWWRSAVRIMLQRALTYSQAVFPLCFHSAA